MLDKLKNLFKRKKEPIPTFLYILRDTPLSVVRNVSENILHCPFPICREEMYFDTTLRLYTCKICGFEIPDEMVNDISLEEFHRMGWKHSVTFINKKLQ